MIIFKKKKKIFIYIENLRYYVLTLKMLCTNYICIFLPTYILKQTLDSVDLF